MHDDYVTMKNGQIWEIRCKGCGTPIKTMLADDQPSETEKINGRTIVRERLYLAALSNYKEVLITFEDGSKHVTPMCADCAVKMQTDKKLVQSVYEADVKQWKSEGQKINKRDEKRKAAKVDRIASVIGV